MDPHFPFKTWALSIVLGSIFLMSYLSLGSDSSELSSIQSLFFYMLLFAFIFSLPALILYYFTWKILTGTNYANAFKKIILALVGVAVTYVTLGLVLGEGKMDLRDFFNPFPNCYAAAVIVSVLIIRLPLKQEIMATPTDSAKPGNFF